MALSKSKQLWDLFNEAECGSYERSAWCDIFLSHVLSELHDGRNVREILNFGNFNGIGTLIGCEILSDVHQVVSHPGDIDDLKPLRSYLISKGWRGLAVLLAMGNVNLACSSELAHLLLYLYPLCQKQNEAKESISNKYLNLKISFITDITIPKSPLKNKISSSHGGISPRVEFHSSHSNNSFARSRRSMFRAGELSVEDNSDLSSDEVVNNSCALQPGGLFKLDPMDFDYFTSVVRSDDEARLDSVLYEPARRTSRVSRPLPRDLVDAATNIVMESYVSPYEFSMLSVQLLTSLATAEHSFSCPENSYPTCTQCIRFSLENLCNLQFNSTPENITIEELAELKVGWTQLLVLCLEKIMGCPDINCSVVLAGILPMMLLVLEDVVSKLNPDEKNDVNTNKRLDEVAYGLMCGAIGFLHSLLLQGSDPDSLKYFLQMVNQMNESGGGCIIDRTVFVLRERSKKILEMLAQLLMTLKRFRLRQSVPSIRRTRTRKSLGRSLADAHHHNDIFGSVTTSPLISKQKICSVSNLAMVFIRLLQNSNKLPADIINYTLRLMMSCGVCCCLPVKPNIKALIKIVKEGSSKSRALAFSLFEKTIYLQLGAYNINSHRTICNVCCSVNQSNFSTSWEKLEMLRELLINNDSRQSYSIVCHLIRIVPLLQDPLKDVVLFKIFFPAFVQCKTDYLKEKTECSEFIVLSALSVFASILNNNTVQHFLIQRGISHILDLIYLPSFSKHCCAVLEKTIVCEWSLSSELPSVTSLAILKTAADTASSAFLAGVGVDGGRKHAMGVKRRGRKSENVPIIGSDFGGASELVQNVAVFWRSYARLALTNPTLRAYFAQTSISEDCGQILDAALGCFTNTLCGGIIGASANDETVSHYLSKLVESLLTFLLATSSLDSGVEDKTTEKVACAISNCDIQKVNIKKICEVLIKCSLAWPSLSLSYETPKIPTMPIWSNWTEALKEMDGASESERSGEDDYVTADEGYDADVELKPKLSFGDHIKSNESESSNPSDTAGVKTSPVIVYPKLCKLVIDLLVRAFKDEKTQDNKSDDEVFASVLLRLGALCHDNVTNSIALSRQSITLSLLHGFAPCLTQASDELSNLRKVLLDLILDLAKTSITQEELTIFIQLFKEENPPMNDLLKTLIALVGDLLPKPNFILSFPVLSPPESESQVEKTLHNVHRRDGVLSCWSCAAVSLVIPAHLSWSPWLSGCSLSMWLRVDRGSVYSRVGPSRKVSLCPTAIEPTRKVSICPPQMYRKVSQVSHASGCSTGFSDVGLSVEEERSGSHHSNKQIILNKHLHMFTLGSENLSLECWVDISGSGVHFRLTRVDVIRGYEVICEQSIESGLEGDAWHHLALNVRDFVQNKKTIIQINWIVDGQKETVVEMAFNGVVVRKQKDIQLLIGHQMTDPGMRTSFSFANVMLFRAPSFNLHRAAGFVCLGPNHTNLTDCRVAKTYINANLRIKRNVNTDHRKNKDESSLWQLSENLLLVYSAHEPNTICFYQGGASSSTSSIRFRPQSTESCGSQLPPIFARSAILAPLNCKKNETIVPVCHLLGGSSIFLYLFARVVELKGSGEDQGNALYLLLQLVQADAHIYTEFINHEYHKLLRKVFLSRNCQPDLHTLKAIFDACCDQSVIVDTPNGLSVNSHSFAVINNPLLLSTLSSIWLDAASEKASLLALLTGLQSLLNDEHPYREFNAEQLNSVGIMATLLNFCKERLVNEDKLVVGRETWLAIIELVRSLMGAPPEFSHVVAVMDTLILLHPANSTYITHLKNSCYMLLSAGQTYTHSLQDNPQVLRMLRQVTSLSLEKWVSVLKTNAQEKDVYTQPIDANKLTKALANLQVQRNSVANDSCSTPKTDDLDSNRLSDDVTLDSGISENAEQENNIVKAADGSQQNLGSFFPSIEVAYQEENESEEEKYTKETYQKEDEDWMIMEGLLLLLKDVLLVLPDNMSQQVLSHVVKFEIILVMANHQNHFVRAAVVQLISSYLKRCSDEERNKFIRMRGFLQLANQIALYPASLPLAEACLNLLTPCVIPFDDQSFIGQMEFTNAQLAFLPPLISLLPRSVHDSLLTHHLINILRTIFCKNALCARTLLDYGLTEVLVKALLASAHMSSVSDRITSQDIVVADLQSLFILVASHFLTAPGLTNMQVICDMRLQLEYMKRVEKERCGFNAHCVRVFRETQCKLVERCLHILLEKVLSQQIDQKGVATLIALGISPPDELLGGRSLGSSHSSISLSNVIPQPGSKEMSKNEIKERLSMVIPFCTHFLINEGTMENGRLVISEVESNFINHLFPLLIQMMSAILEKRSYGRRNGANALLWGVREPLKSETAELLVWLLCPRQSVETRMFTIASLLASSKSKEIIAACLQTHPQVEQKFTVFLWDLMYNNKLNNAEVRTCMELKESLQQWGIISPHAVGNAHDLWGDECNMLLTQMDRARSSWEKQLEPALIRCVTKNDNLIKALGDDAMMMTRVAVDAQNKERKALMANIRMVVSTEVSSSAKWRSLVDLLTHQDAIWCDERTLPQFWQLDPTEGPHRIRTRLMPTQLSLDPRYLKPDHRHKLDSSKYHRPLSFLFERHRETCPSAVLIERLHCNEKIRTMVTARVITPAHEVPGELLLGESSLYFVADDKHLCSTLDTDSTTWPFEDVREVLHKRFQLKERAIELFLRTGRTYLIAFETCKQKDDFAAALSDCDLPNLVTVDTLVHYTNQWRERHISNWEYLTQLNKLAGRSFNDLMQYPVLPFILSDYSSQRLDLTNIASFRNLKKPMAIQNKQNEPHYINNYNELLTGLKQVSLNRDPYHYGSHYSNSGTVLHFLVRLPPFTTMLLQYQDRNFDLPDRTFHNMDTTWRLTSCDSTTDVKEMLPEFFYLPEFFTNFLGFDFGVRQNGNRVDDVQLPPWCNNDPRLFVLIHRQALESEYVTENLPHWIDLVFGYKQTGKAAVDAVNVFHPATYCGFDVESIQDPLERLAWETMVKTYGQTPRQLLRSAHPLVVQSLVTSSTTSKPVLKSVKGLKWGNYVGTPAEPEPKILWKQTSKGPAVPSTLLPLSTNEVYALPPATTCLIRYTKEKGLSLVNSTTVRAALVTWGHPDGIIRIKVRKELPAEPLIFITPLNPVTICSSFPESNQLWIGHASGSVTVLKYAFGHDKYNLDFSSLPLKLQAHNAAVTSINISRSFSIVVTGSRDATLIIWDLNNISYIRKIKMVGCVVLTAISSTSGDIASVVQTSEPTISKLNLHSINAVPLGGITVEDGPITSVCFSSAVEGTSVNVLACGLANGTIRLWSTWDLTLVRTIQNPGYLFPIISLTYSHDAQHLYAGCADGTVLVWEGSGIKYDSNPPKFFNFKSLL